MCVWCYSKSIFAKAVDSCYARPSLFGWRFVAYLVPSHYLKQWCWLLIGPLGFNHNKHFVTKLLAGAWNSMALAKHDEARTWKWFPHYWPFVMESHRSPVDFPIKGPLMRNYGISCNIEQTVEWAIELQVIWDAMVLILHVSDIWASHFPTSLSRFFDNCVILIAVELWVGDSKSCNRYSVYFYLVFTNNYLWLNCRAAWFNDWRMTKIYIIVWLRRAVTHKMWRTGSNYVAKHLFGQQGGT